MNILITGSAGFIGYSVALKLLKLGNKIVGVDTKEDLEKVRKIVKENNITI